MGQSVRNTRIDDGVQQFWENWKNYGPRPFNPSIRQLATLHFLSWYLLAMSVSGNQPGVESAQEADIHDPLTSTVLDDMDAAEADKMLTDSSTNLMESQTNLLSHDAANEEIPIESFVPTHEAEIDYADLSAYDDQPWADDADDALYTEELPSISLADQSPYEQKAEEQPRTITDPTHSEVSISSD